MSNLLCDIRFALRNLRKGFASTVLATVGLATAIGVSAAVFATLYPAFFPPLPFREPDRLAILWERLRAGNWENEVPVSTAKYQDWKTGSMTFSDMAAFTYPQVFNFEGGTVARRINGVSATPNLLPVLGIVPLRGAWFSVNTNQDVDSRLVVVTHRFWVNDLSQDQNVLGREIRLNRKSYRIMGVLDPDFQLPVLTDEADVILPFQPQADEVLNRSVRRVIVVGRIRNGVKLSAATAEIGALSTTIGKAYPATDGDSSPSVVNVEREFRSDASKKGPMLISIGITVLALAFSTFWGVFFLRAVAGRYGVAVQFALGAPRSRTVRQLLVQSVTLVGSACCLALLFAAWAIRIIDVYRPVYLPPMIRIRVGAPVLLFIVVLGVLIALLTHVTSVFSLPTTCFREYLQGNASRVSSGYRLSNQLRNVLVCCELGLALVLLVSAGVMIRSFVRLSSVEVGFDPADLISARVTLDDSKYPHVAMQQAFFHSVLERLQGVKGIESITITNSTPFGDSGSGTRFYAEGGSSSSNPSDVPMAGADVVEPNYFRTLRSTIIRGRSFEPNETTPVAIVNETLAERTWPGQNPIGKRIVLLSPEMNLDEGSISPGTRTVVGVVTNTKWSLDAPKWPEVYVPFDQNPLAGMEFVMRCTQLQLCTEQLRQSVAQADAGIPLYSFFELQDRIAKSVAPQRLQLLMVSVLAGLALLVSVLGLYSVMSFIVTSRTNEIGVRMALGARPNDVVQYIFRRSCILIAIGVSAGVLVAVGLSPLLSAALFGVRPNDGFILFLGIAVLSVVALVATYIPARRAARINPGSALRVV